ncbi:MAG: DUF2203 domain-containing protein [Candidatus Dormibacteria bacterium]|jgi:hypothetical protein
MSAVPDHLFGKREADGLLPRLRELIGALQTAATSDAAQAAREHLASAGRSNGSAGAAAAASRAAAEIDTALDEIDRLGVILRDAATGLCDFPSTRDGREVYLCWKLDEDEVAWWHPRDVGIAGRRKL